MAARGTDAAQDADLMAIGRHCANPECGELDFLPFPCPRCGKVYCLAHRACPCLEQSRETVLVCPLCAQAVIVQPGEDADLAHDRHTRTECDPSNYNRVHRKPRCLAAGCKQKLTSTNSYDCKQCGAKVCLAHRLPADHQCPGRAATAAAAAQSRLGLGSLRRFFGASGSSSDAATVAAGPARAQQQQGQQHRQQQQAAAQGGSRAGAGQRASAPPRRGSDSMQSQLQQYRQRHANGGQAAAAPHVVDLTTSPAASAAAGAASAEVCPQCGARFAGVGELIAHAEAAHSSGWASGAVGQQQAQQQQQQQQGWRQQEQHTLRQGRADVAGLERCPHCGCAFSDAVQLVEHVERQHSGGGDGTHTCVLC